MAAEFAAVVAERTGTDVTALRELFAELLRDKENTRRIAAMMAGADLHYDVGDTHPLAGRWAPDLVVNGVRLAELTRKGRPLLLDLTEEGVLGKELSGWHDRVDTVTGRADGPVTAMLPRPDGYVAWASSAASPDHGALRTALTRWFGVAS